MKCANSLTCLVVLGSFLNGLSDALLSCSQCNMRQRGIGNTCLAPRNMTNCIGCMKTVTKVKLRDSGYMTSWERLSVVVSRYCMRQGSTNVQPEGCYYQQNNGGYTERCFCYSDHCNSGASSLSHGVLSSIVSMPSSLLLCLGVVLVTLISTTNAGYTSTAVKN